MRRESIQQPSDLHPRESEMTQINLEWIKAAKDYQESKEYRESENAQ